MNMKHFRTYKSLCTEFYDLEKPEAPLVELSFYIEYAKKAKGIILEPMCGSGRFLLPLLEQGFQVEGIDASSYMLSSLRKKCDRRRLNPLLHETMLQKARLNKKFSLIIIPSGSFCLIHEENDIKEALETMFDLLEPDGKLVFEIEMVTMLSEEKKQCHFWCGRFVKKPDGSMILLSTFPYYDEKTQIDTTICKYELIQKNQIIQTEVEEFCLRLYKAGEIEQFLQNAGFIDIKRYKLYEPSDPSQNDPAIIIECRKGEK